MVRNHLKHVFGVSGLTFLSAHQFSGRGPVILAFQLCRASSGVKMPPDHCILFQHLSRICSLLCRRESQRNVVGVPINTTTASDPDTGVLYFCTKEQVQREEA